MDKQLAALLLLFAIRDIGAGPDQIHGPHRLVRHDLGSFVKPAKSSIWKDHPIFHFEIGTKSASLDRWKQSRKIVRVNFAEQVFCNTDRFVARKTEQMP